MFNSIQLQGNLVRDTKFADTRGDTDILNFTIASSRKYKDKEDVVFVDCTAYGAVAVNISKFFSKGSPIGVTGRLSLSTWEDKDRNKRSKLYITVEGFHFVGETGKGRDKRDDNRDRGNSRGGGSRGRDDNRDRDRSRDDNRGQARDGGRNSRDGDSRYQDEVPF
ncbi:hypothetical protein LCGC14_0475280 [marine sediment metagenome]|uniref:Single-stranded DNA-binding protein n=1 Tax=marine sediment metagenome TaxID=412755 RepID=A0A0F9SAX7_9ZZZZ